MKTISTFGVLLVLVSLFGCDPIKPDAKFVGDQKTRLYVPVPEGTTPSAVLPEIPANRRAEFDRREEVEGAGYKESTPEEMKKAAASESPHP